ncbi:MAG: ATP-binding protein [Selenomonadaceae bacterium]|nr:ATP-binding protein [Selenomonadaceae bacterium]
MYIERHISHTILRLGKAFPAVLVTGARQVGKSTVLKKILPDMPYFTLDNIGVHNALVSDPQGFLELHGAPLVIDEIQRAPGAFQSIKYEIDKDRQAGMYFITGSQRYSLMQGISESLAGRVFPLEMLGLSAREFKGESFDKPFLPTKEYLRGRGRVQRLPLPDLWGRIHRGSMPELYSNENIGWEDFWGAYVTSYIERDVHQLGQVGSMLSFAKFLTALAARTGELLNLQSVARESDINIRTAQNWLSILEASGIIFILQPYFVNINKRMVKTPKVYFADTGLVCYLCKWSTPEVLAAGNAAGNIYENYVFMEIMKSYLNAGRQPEIYFFRNSDMAEVDFLLVEGNNIYPIEVKKKTAPDKKDIKHFEVLKNSFPDKNVAEGCVVCNSENFLPLEKDNYVIPVEYI